MDGSGDGSDGGSDDDLDRERQRETGIERIDRRVHPAGTMHFRWERCVHTSLPQLGLLRTSGSKAEVFSFHPDSSKFHDFTGNVEYYKWIIMKFW